MNKEALKAAFPVFAVIAVFVIMCIITLPIEKEKKEVNKISNEYKQQRNIVRYRKITGFKRANNNCSFIFSIDYIGYNVII